MSHADNRALECADDWTSAYASRVRGAPPLPPPSPQPPRPRQGSRGRTFEPREPTVAAQRTPSSAATGAQRRTPSAEAATAAGVSTAPASQLPGWRHGPAPPRPRPSLAPAPTCAEFVYLATMATRGGAAGRRGEERQGAGPRAPKGGGGEQTSEKL